MSARAVALWAIAGGLALAPAAAWAQESSLGERVVGGSAAEPGQWPYQVYVRVGQAACGGTLIAADWVLTAAHCTVMGGKPVPASDFQIRAGSLRKSTGGELIGVQQVIAHEGYNQGTAFANDIALLKLARPVTAVPLVALEATDMGRGRPAIDTQASPWARVIGWGYVDPATRQTSEVLEQAPLPLVENGRCNQAMGMGDTGTIDARRICAGPSEGGVDSCNGDSGGPLLVADRQGNWVQVGVVSYGEQQCGKPGKYGVYTRVGAFAPWIERNLGRTATAPAAPVAPITLGAPSKAPTLIAAAAREDGRVRLKLLPGGAMREGDRFRVQVTSNFDGYLALFDVNDRNEVTQLFPNPRSRTANRDGSIRASAPLTLPDPSYGFEFRAAKPYGRGTLIAVVTRDSASLNSVVRAEDGLKTLPDGDGTLARLEVVLKPTAPSGASPPSDSWAAGRIDYIVEKPQ